MATHGFEAEDTKYLKRTVNTKIGNYQIHWAEGMGFGFYPRKHWKRNVIYRYILDWTFVLGKLAIHKYKKNYKPNPVSATRRKR